MTTLARVLAMVACTPICIPTLCLSACLKACFLGIELAARCISSCASLAAKSKRKKNTIGASARANVIYLRDYVMLLTVGTFLICLVPVTLWMLGDIQNLLAWTDRARDERTRWLGWGRVLGDIQGLLAWTERAREERADNLGCGKHDLANPMRVEKYDGDVCSLCSDMRKREDGVARNDNSGRRRRRSSM